MDDYLGAEQLITKQLDLKTRKLLNGNILSASDLEGVEEQLQKTPAAQVIFFDEIPITRDKGKSRENQFVDQFWSVIIVVKNVKDKSGKAARIDAGPIISNVLEHLQNFDMGHPYSKLTREKSPYRATYRNGFLYFPLMFKTRFTTKGNNNGRC